MCGSSVMTSLPIAIPDKTLEITPSSLAWYAIHTHPRQENRAAQNLSMWGVQLFTPSILKKYEQGAAQKALVEPLFPGYIFARFDCAQMLHKINFTRGVHGVLTFGGKPAPIHDDIIALCRARISPDGFVHIAHGYKPGDRVVIQSGPFQNMHAVFEKEMPDHERVSVLLNSVNWQPRVELYSHQIARTA